MILIDEPTWRAHGTTWSHLVSDTSLTELHDFASRTAIPFRSFDLDHYDVPAQRHSELIAAGAVPVTRRRLVAALHTSGIRVSGRDRSASRRAALQTRWQHLLPEQPRIGEELLDRWHEPHRAYHGPTHLKHVLDSLPLVTTGSNPTSPNASGSRVEQLALWFHDAVYNAPLPRTTGLELPLTSAGEEASAQLAVTLLGPVTGTGRLTVVEVDEVARLVRLTATHAPEPGDLAGGRVCDADLAILGAHPERYRQYTQQVRREFHLVPDEVFWPARRRVLTGLLDMPRLFNTPVGQQRWEAAARDNIRTEIQHLQN